MKPHILPERQWNPISYLKDNGTYILPERQWNPIYYLKDNGTPYITWKTMELHILPERQWNPISYLKDNEVADPLDGALAHEDVGWSDCDLRQSSQKLHGCQSGVEVILPWHHQTVTHQWCRMAKQAMCSVCGQSYRWKQTDASQTVVPFTLYEELGLREGEKATLSKNKKITGEKQMQPSFKQNNITNFNFKNTVKLLPVVLLW